MVRIITGDIDSGKSRLFLQLYKQSGGGAGLFSKKLYDENGEIIGYNLILLPDEQELNFITLKDYISETDLDAYLYQGRFAFLKSAFLTGEKFVMEQSGTVTVWLDEIGGLEIKGLGYHNLIKNLLYANRDLVITIRNTLLKSFIEKYKVDEYRLL